MNTCCVSWCDVDDVKRPRKYCDLHKSKFANNISRRPWLNYKVERFNSGNDCCERCGFRPDPKLPERCRYYLFDVDHKDPSLKGTLEGEQPSNYQLLCKNCHAIKSYMEGDLIAKRYR